MTLIQMPLMLPQTCRNTSFWISRRLFLPQLWYANFRSVTQKLCSRFQLSFLLARRIIFVRSINLDTWANLRVSLARIISRCVLSRLTHKLTLNEIHQVFTKSKWYVVPIFWLPIAIYLFLRSALQFTAPLPSFMVDPSLPLSGLVNLPMASIYKTLICFFIGNFTWTLLVYLFHRFLFHVDYYLPDKPIFLLLHFLLHGVHHYVPMDRYVALYLRLNSVCLMLLISRLRVVMPPPLFAMLEWPMTRLAYKLFPLPVANGIISGAFVFCKSDHKQPMYQWLTYPLLKDIL